MYMCTYTHPFRPRVYMQLTIISTGLSRVFEAQKEENLAQLGQLEAEVAEAIGILENHYYSSRVCPSPHLKNGAK